MLDIAAWTHRVSAFLRQLTRLPGAIDIDDSIEPPVTDSFDRDWLESDRSGIPDVLRRFLATGSKRCVFSYKWTPPAGYPTADCGINSGQRVFNGGGDLCEAAKYHLTSLGVPVAGAMAEEQTLHRVPILELQGGEGIISLASQSDGSAWIVVYVKEAGERSIQVLSPSFEQFLLDWEKTCYTYTSINNLAPWLDPITRQLRPDPAKSRALYRLLTGAT
jgi:hypothetical protein